MNFEERVGSNSLKVELRSEEDGDPFPSLRG